MINIPFAASYRLCVDLHSPVARIFERGWGFGGGGGGFFCVDWGPWPNVSVKNWTFLDLYGLFLPN